MSSATGPSLPHRAVSNIRTGSAQSPSGPTTSPHTPTRTTASAFGSPSALRADDDIVIVELGSRFVRVGFAGDAAPKAVLQLGPEQQHRVGDYRAWLAGHRDGSPMSGSGADWGRDYELWQYDLRSLDLGLVEDKLDRILREAFTKYLLTDSRPRRTALVLPSTLPLPLLSTVLNTIFNRFQSPLISLFSAAVMSTVAAGQRSGLVVDLGWPETTVTSVYEYREIRCTRTVRGGKSLVDALGGLLRDAVGADAAAKGAVSFDQCEDIACRFLWCRRPGNQSDEASSRGLPTLHEQDETESGTTQEGGRGDTAFIPIPGGTPPTTLELPFQKLAELCEKEFFDPQCAAASFDDHELPVHLLVYEHLLQLPIDVRAVCMSRIIFTGGCAAILGLKGRIFDELSSLVQDRGWEPVQGKAVDQLKANPRLRRSAGRQGNSVPVGVAAQQDSGSGSEQDGVWHDAANAVPEPDPIEQQLKKSAGRERRPSTQGVLRCVGTLGAWGGASLMCQLRIPAMASIDRDAWLLQGTNGAARPGEVDAKAQQRQSMGAGGLIRAGGGGGAASWTLGTWGYL